MPGGMSHRRAHSRVSWREGASCESPPHPRPPAITIATWSRSARPPPPPPQPPPSTDVPDAGARVARIALNQRGDQYAYGEHRSKPVRLSGRCSRLPQGRRGQPDQQWPLGTRHVPLGRKPRPHLPLEPARRRRRDLRAGLARRDLHREGRCRPRPQQAGRHRRHEPARPLDAVHHVHPHALPHG